MRRPRDRARRSRTNTKTPAGQVRDPQIVHAGLHRHKESILDQPPQFHHILDWAKVRHHDARHMLVVCGTCHSRCTNGAIDYKCQVEYKTLLKRNIGADEPADPHRARKREEDLWTLRDLFSHLPRTFVDWFFDRATHNQIPIEYA